MTAPNAARSGVGFRSIRVFALNSDGYLDAESTNVAYEGVAITGARALTLNDPEPQQIVHRGDDRVFALDTLPPTDPISGEMRVGKTSDTVDAVLTDDKAFYVKSGAARLFGIGTDNRGDESQVGVLAYRQALDTDPDGTDFGVRRWEFRIFPKAYIIPREGGLVDTPEERAYTVRPLFVKEHLWGVAFSTSTEGFEQAQGLRGIAKNKPKVIAYQGDNTVTTFALDPVAVNTDNIGVWVNGVDYSGTATLATNQVDFGTSPPTTSANITIFYEHA